MSEPHIHCPHPVHRVLVVGGGWYGCHAAARIRRCHPDVVVTLLDADPHGVFGDCASYYNQNRLHEGLHYCRDHATRRLCREGKARFETEYPQLVEPIRDNHYLVAEDSGVDAATICHVFAHEGTPLRPASTHAYQTVQPGGVFDTDEGLIHSGRAREFFRSTGPGAPLDGVEVVTGMRATAVQYRDNGATVTATVTATCDRGRTEREFEADLLLDCTFNQWGLSKTPHIYELTCSLVYSRPCLLASGPGAVTVIDGPFVSLYPRDPARGTYTLTDVENTPVACSDRFSDIVAAEATFDPVSRVPDLRSKMEAKIRRFFPAFDDEFVFEGYFLSKKTKPVSGSASRDVAIEILHPSALSVNCGKIYGIFAWGDCVERYVAVGSGDGR